MISYFWEEDDYLKVSPIEYIFTVISYIGVFLIWNEFSSVINNVAKDTPVVGISSISFHLVMKGIEYVIFVIAFSIIVGIFTYRNRITVNEIFWGVRILGNFTIVFAILFFALDMFIFSAITTLGHYILKCGIFIWGIGFLYMVLMFFFFKHNQINV